MLTRRTLLVASGTLAVFLTVSLLPFHERVREQVSIFKDRIPVPAFFDYEEQPPSVQDNNDAAQLPESTEAAKAAPVPQEEHDPVAQDWRTHLESEHGGLRLPQGHSDTLGFSRIYVLSSPANPTRRDRMDLMAKALGTSFTYVDTTSPKDAKIIWIGERVAEVRAQKVRFIAERASKPASALGGLQSGSVWLHPGLRWMRYPLPNFVKSSTWHWKNQLPKPRYFAVHFPSLAEDRFDGLDWVQYLHDPESTLDPEDPNFTPREDMHDPLEKDERFQVSAESIADWYDHYQLLRFMDRHNDTTSLVLRDDVDIEWDFERLWQSVERVLPIQADKNFTDWHLVNLGYESDLEQTHPHYIHPLLHSATEALNLTAFAISLPGRKTLLRILADPWLAYQTRFDVALSTLSRSFYTATGYTTAFNAFSLHPPVASQLNAQLAAWTADTAHLESVKHSAALADSTMERLWAHAGVKIDMSGTTQARVDKTAYRIRVPEKGLQSR